MWTGVAAFLLLAVVGVGCYYFGRSDGIEWVLTHTRIEYIPEEAEDEKETD